MEVKTLRFGSRAHLKIGLKKSANSRARVVWKVLDVLERVALYCVTPIFCAERNE